MMKQIEQFSNRSLSRSRINIKKALILKVKSYNLCQVVREKTLCVAHFLEKPTKLYNS